MDNKLYYVLHISVKQYTQKTTAPKKGFGNYYNLPLTHYTTVIPVFVTEKHNLNINI